MSIVLENISDGKSYLLHNGMVATEPINRTPEEYFQREGV